MLYGQVAQAMPVQLRRTHVHAAIWSKELEQESHLLIYSMTTLPM